MELLPEIVPLLIKSLEDETPAVARQVIACGVDLFRSTLERVAVQVVFLFLFFRVRDLFFLHLVCKSLLI